MLAWASPEDLHQQRIDPIADSRRIALARTGNVEGPNLQSVQPVPDRGSRFRVYGIENEEWASEAGRAPFCPIRSQVLVRHGAGPQDQRRIGVADVPFRPLRTGDLWRLGASVLWSFLKREARGDDAGLAFTPGRAPPAAI